MTLPRFGPEDDPGPDFVGLLNRYDPPRQAVGSTGELAIPHGTTCLAVKCDVGVVMGGDRRATAGNLVANRSIEKVFPADRHSGVAIAGAAGAALEMVKLFQLQLEHYEKVEGHALSLEGKANQLAQMLRQNLPMAMQGLAVVPIFAGYDMRREEGRLFAYDVTGGRYEERLYTATGSGSLHATTAIKLGYRPDLGRDEAVALIASALVEAADEDTATGGPDLVRGLYPSIATITAPGFARLDDAEIESVFDAALAARGYLSHRRAEPEPDTELDR